MDDLKLVEMELREIQIKEDAIQTQVIVLGEKGGARQFPIFIGYVEAIALDSAIHGFQNARPMTHDLILNVIEGTGCELQRVVVDDLRSDTFFGKLVVRTSSGTEEWIDSRPSDAIVLASKRRVPIFVADHVLESVSPSDDE